MLGGDHTATVPVIEALAPSFPELRILQLDAHPDTREEFLGERYNYASAMARVMDVVDPVRVFQIGMRTGSREEYLNRRPNFFPVLAGHPVDVVRGLLPRLRDHPLYVTIDVDVLDPSEAPGTGSPEPGGLRVPELLEIVRMLGDCQIIGGDLVEVAHAWDPTGRTGIAASWVIREAMLTWWGDLGEPRARSNREREYTAPRLYEIAFDMNRKGEVDFLVHCFKRFARRPVRRVLDIACGTGPHLVRPGRAGLPGRRARSLRRNIAFLGERLADKGLTAIWSSGT